GYGALRRPRTGSGDSKVSLAMTSSDRNRRSRISPGNPLVPEAASLYVSAHSERTGFHCRCSGMTSVPDPVRNGASGVSRLPARSNCDERSSVPVIIPIIVLLEKMTMIVFPSLATCALVTVRSETETEEPKPVAGTIDRNSGPDARIQVTAKAPPGRAAARGTAGRL